MDSEVKRRLASGAVAIALVAGFDAPAKAASTTPVFLSGDAAPGTGGTFLGFGPIATNDAGTLAFEGTVSTAGRGLWRQSALGLAQLLALPAPAAGGPAGATLDFLDGLALPQGDGPVLVRVRLSSGDDALYSVDSSQGLLPIAIEGQAAPGTVGAVFQSIRASLRVSDAGESVFFAVLEGGDTTAFNATGVWSGSGGAVSLVARQEDAAPGGGGETWFQMDQYPRIAPDGTIGLASVLFGLTGTSGIWTGNAAPLSPVILTPMTIYANAVIGDAGALVFLKTPTGGAPSTVEAGTPGNLRTVAAQGAQAPGLPPGVELSLLGVEPRINRNGQVAFRAATVEATPRAGLWSEGAGPLELVALVGDPAPGTGGLVYVEFLGFELNDLGQLAFLAEVGASVEFPGDPALYFAAPGECWR